MLHLVKCCHTKPLWNKCLQFCRDTLDAPDMTRRVERAIIFNQENEGKMLPEAACALIRHAFNIFYHYFANVDKDHTFERRSGQGARRVALHTAVAHTLSNHRIAVGSSGRPARKASKLFSARSYSSEVCPKPGASPASSPASPARSTSSSAANASFS